MKIHLVIFLFLLRSDSIISWESEELDLFDLVEELGLNNNFYDFLGVSKSADVSEIKRAYRKLSLIWHPDKSDESNAELKFRQLVGVYEVLKDEQRRARYDQILVEGLPKWNQPLYYYRRARKLRFWEILTILSSITTIGHYLVLWAIYFEQSLTMNERSAEMRKKLEKKMKKSSKNKDIDYDAIDEELSRALPEIHSPKFSDILPIRCAQLIVDHHFFIPLLKSVLSNLFYRRQHLSATNEDANSDDNEQSTVSKRSQVVRIMDIVPEMAPRRRDAAVSYTSPMNVSSLEDNNHQSSKSVDSTRPWSEDEKQLLCKIIIRFPPGTPRRWEKIADALARPVSQVVDMAKQIQHAVGTGPTNIQENHASFLTPTKIDQNLITEREQSQSASDWSKTDQQLLECALKNIPKDTSGTDRWEQIARCIPGKTRDECLARYRFIAQKVRAKKML